MTSRRITMQDIADACGLSRNTVSKVFNGRGNVPQSTKDAILKKARELGYGLPGSEIKPANQQSAKSIALLTTKIPVDYHFATVFFASFTDQVSRAGYTLRMYEISPEELKQKRLPDYFNIEETAGLIAIELFDRDYLDMMCSLGLPTVTIDGPSDALVNIMPCDFVSMENMAGISAVTNRLIEKGARRIGFVGDRYHCCSFLERWHGFYHAMLLAGLSVDRSACILEPDSPDYGDLEWLSQQLSKMPSIPDAFVCCNDYIALHLAEALKKRGLRIPEDIMLTGFDDIVQAAVMEPSLTTVHIPGTDIGRTAASVLIRRIENPTLPFSWTRVITTPVFRSTTK